jgi:tryptophan-rich sensory protein
MNVLASPAQLRASFLRWALFMVPLILLIGFAAGQLGGPDTPWFAGLDKPAIYPPPVLFGIVWTILFILIGLALALVASAWGAHGRGIALVAFAIHFLVTQSWTAVFFGMQDMISALMVLGFGIAIMAIKLAQKAAHHSMSFGYHRAEIIGTILSLAFLWGITIWLLFAAYDRLFSPPEIE